MRDTCKKCEIFEKYQKPQHNHTVAYQENLTPFRILILINQQCKNPGGEDHAYKQQKILWSTPGIKDQGKNKHNHVFLPDRIGKIIRNKIQRKKEKYKKQA